ncbi:MAG TPA: excinuclease ABC subunit UvrA, partial [Planctomycetes bacterium]|nr:excinuclease ABC subunit UvrA [Planctomycetota bacterium]
MEPEFIRVSGAREHNLKGISVEVPKKQLVVFTGPSGSGKSSMAIDTIYAEGRRRFVESLSAYARQFLGQKEKPRYDKISGLSPSIAVEQKAASVNPRSTVGTITEIHDYLRVLYARVGTQFCHECGEAVEAQTAQQIVKRIESLPEGTKAIVLAPRIVNRKGEFRDELALLRKQGLARVRLNGEIQSLDSMAKLDKRKKNTLEAVIDRLVIRAGQTARVTDSVETALRLGEGRLTLLLPADESERIFSERLACEPCGISFPDLTPQSFSYNSPQGLCPECNGLGHTLDMDPSLVVPDPTKSIVEGAVTSWPKDSLAEGRGWTACVVRSLADLLEFELETPWQDLPADVRDKILHGLPRGQKLRVRWRRGRVFNTRWEGVLPQMKRRLLETRSEERQQYYAQFHSYRACNGCGGGRLRPESMAVKVRDRDIHSVCDVSVAETAAFVDELREGLVDQEQQIASELLKEIRARLKFLEDVGLDYLSLSRPGPSLSGGESQRIQLASQIGSELSGVVYVLDEPSIGLHSRDANKLVSTLEHLRDKGNTIVVVEHDRDTIERADWVIDFGPGAGRHGGEVTAAGTPDALAKDPNSLTGLYLCGKETIEVPAARRAPAEEHEIVVYGAAANNLKGIDVTFPLGLLTCVTGVSGAGKSSLVNQILLPGLERHLHKKATQVGEHRSIEGYERIDKVIAIDQQPIGRTPRSNPATYVKLFDLIRDFYANLPESKVYGFKKGRFSFNVKGGRCEGCQGSGVKQIEMHFLADVFVTCQDCEGKRFNDATLRVTYQGNSIADVLNMSVSEAIELFANHPKILRFLQTLEDVGLGYVALGQPSPTLSGGEAQRVKLARELGKRSTGRTLYVLDEPSTGLHFDDIKKLLAVLDRLVDAGNTVLVIEHNLDIVKTADHVIDIGPEGGSGGGELIATGTPEEVAACEASHTGRFLLPLLEDAAERGEVVDPEAAREIAVKLPVGRGELRRAMAERRAELKAERKAKEKAAKAAKKKTKKKKTAAKKKTTAKKKTAAKKKTTAKKKTAKKTAKKKTANKTTKAAKKKSGKKKTAKK